VKPALILRSVLLFLGSNINKIYHIMKKVLISAAMCLLIVILIASPALAAKPGTSSVKGKLVADSNTATYSGTYSFSFTTTEILPEWNHPGLAK
jgi:hypothetical protein